MDGILSLFSNPMMLAIIALILFGGQIKLGDKTLLQFILDLLGGLFKPVPVSQPTSGQYGGPVIDMVKGLFSNPMVLIALVVGLMMVTGGGGCGGLGGCKAPASPATPPDPLTVTPTSFETPYTGSHYADVQRLHLQQSGQVPIVWCGGTPQDVTPWRFDAADFPPMLDPADYQQPVTAAACSAAGCSRPAAQRVVYRDATAQYGFWQRGPVRRLVAAGPVRRLMAVRPLRRLARGVGWLFRR
jgi:hypothetical protein